MADLFNKWARRNPQWETKYEDSLIRVFCDYKRGVNQFGEARAKVYGAGYELYILAFFIGLYFDRTKPLNKSKSKDFGWPIEHWGNIEARNGRLSYPEIVKYIFAALIAKTDIDWLAVDKDEISDRKAVDMLIDKMEQYANFGFSYLSEKLEDNPNCFYTETGFFDIFISILNNDTEDVNNNDTTEVEAESLD